jgi:hypothetical protein
VATVPEATAADEVTRGPAWGRWAIVVAVVVAVGIGLGVWLAQSDPSAPIGPEGVPLQSGPILAPASTTVNRTPVDGITCRTTSQQAVHFHIHIHIAIFVNGQLRRVPAGVGIPPPFVVEHFPSGIFMDNSPIGGCLYWLHVHANDGIIHVEAPYRHTFVLGQFFDVWNQPLSPTQVGPARGPVVAFVNGSRFTGNPRNIPLLRQADVQLDVGSPVVPFKLLHFHVKGECGQGKLTCHPTSERGSTR